MPNPSADASEPPSSSSEFESDSEHDDNQPRPVKPKISEALSSLGIYAHSVKPRNGWLKESKCSIRIISDFDDMNTTR